MFTAVAVVVLIAGLIAWLGQSIAFLAPATAVKLGVLEPDDELDPSLHIIEAQAMGLTDMLLGWMLPASAVLLLLRHPIWPYLSLVGSGVFIYFSVLIILSRIYLKRSGRKVGRASSERAAYIFGGIWIASSVAMIILAVSSLSG
ncbi:MAG: hypothetical protein AMS18_14485 [Gemmatimonas sp. SG8_17]|nr:MAG: hypothetical protein AMS18_14485 [Gemmatimonas sp. SG8_17]